MKRPGQRIDRAWPRPTAGGGRRSRQRLNFARRRRVPRKLHNRPRRQADLAGDRSVRAGWCLHPKIGFCRRWTCWGGRGADSLDGGGAGQARQPERGALAILQPAAIRFSRALLRSHRGSVTTGVDNRLSTRPRPDRHRGLGRDHGSFRALCQERASVRDGERLAVSLRDARLALDGRSSRCGADARDNREGCEQT